MTGLAKRLKMSDEPELDELMFKNQKFQADSGEIGDGISPEKKKINSNYKTEHITLLNKGIRTRDKAAMNETQQDKARKILQTFDFNKLFYPSSKQRNAKSLQEGRHRQYEGGAEQI